MERNFIFIEFYHVGLISTTNTILLLYCVLARSQVLFDFVNRQNAHIKEIIEII